MLKFKLSLLVKNAKFKAALVTLLIASMVAGIIYIPKNKASKTSTSASSTNYTLNSTQVIAKSMELAGKPYLGGENSGQNGKGYNGNLWNKKAAYNPSKLLTAKDVKGVDCSGLIFWTLASLMKSNSIKTGTAGFYYNNPVPVDTAHWLADSKGKTITKSTNLTFNGQKINVLKANEQITSNMRYYQYKDANGNIVDLPAGTIIVTDGKNYVSGAQNHTWIYIGDLGTANATEVQTILKNRFNVNVPANTIKSVGSNTHWRIEASGTEGVVINNADPNKGPIENGKKAVGNIWAYQLSNDEVTVGNYTVELVKVKADGTTVITSSEATFNVNGTDMNTTKGVLTAVSGKNISNETQKDTYTITETKAPEGYIKYTGTITLNVGFKKNAKTNKYVIDGSKTNCTAPGLTGTVFKVSEDLAKITIYVPNTDIPEEPEGKYSIQLVKVKEDGKTVIKSDVATFEVNGKSIDTKSGRLTVVSNKNIENEKQVDTYTITETKAPEGYNKFNGTLKLDVAFELDKETNTYIIDRKNTKGTGFEENTLFLVSADGSSIMVYVPNTEIQKEPEGKYSIELVKVKEDGTTVITSSEATFEINGNATETKSGKLTVVSDKNIENETQKDTYTITETKAPEGYDKLIGDLKLDVAFKLNKDANKYVIDADKTAGTGFEGKTKFVVSPDGTKITVYVPNTETVTVHKGVKTVENQNAGYYYKDLKSGKEYTEEQLAEVLHKWVIESSIEAGIEKYNKYVITDKVDTTKLDFSGLDKVKVSLLDIEGKETILKINEDYKVVYENDTLKVIFIDKDFTSNTIKNAQVGSLTGYKFRVVFNTAFKVVDGKLVVISESVKNAENKATLTYDNGSGKEVDKETETPEVHTGAVSVFKYDDKNGNGVHDEGEKALVGAEFKIAESKEDAEAGKFVKDAEGNDLVAISNEHGVATFTGLEFGGDATKNGVKQADGTFKYDWEKASKDYYIVETKAPTGFALMKETVKVTVSKNSTECIDLTDKMEAIANQELKGTYNFKITKLDAETTKIIESETTVFDINVYSKVNEDGTVNDKDIVELKDINNNVIKTTNIHAKTNGITEISNIKITDGEKKAGTYYFVIEETQAPDEYTEIGYRVVVPIKFELKDNEYVATHDSENSYALVKVNGKEVKKSLKEMATNNNECVSSEQLDFAINVNVPNKHKAFDLSLRKFITAVNDIEPEVSRVPQVDVSKLASGESTTATYNHTKEPLVVNTSDIVTYTIRVYNEGEINGYAAQIMDDIPEGLEFVSGTATNNKYKWVLYKEVSEDTENTVTFDGKKYVVTTDSKEADIIVTDYLSKENGKDNLIKAFDGKTLSYKDVKVDFKVVEPTTSDRIVTNYAQVTKHTDYNGNTNVIDRDSTPNKWIENEDDQDIEKIRVKYFDLSLLKFVSKAIVYENGTKNVIETGHTGYENPEPVVKVDLQNANLNNVTVKFEYTIKITNEGEVEGYAKEISDYIPEGLKFMAEDNKNWKEVDGKIVTDALADTLLQPGESAEVTVILTWINGENNMGLKVNTAEISEDYNEYGTPDIDSTPNNKVPGEDDIDDAPVMLTIRTGMPKQYIGVGFGMLVIITAGFAIIRKKVISK